MIFLNSLIVYSARLFRTFDFYFRPGLRREGYPGYLDHRKNKFAQAWLRYVPIARNGIRGAWNTYNQIMLARDINKFNLLLKKVENMLEMIHNGTDFHITMSKSEEVIALKKLAMNICYEVGLLNEYNHNFDEALDSYDRGAQMLNCDEPGWRNLIEIRDKIYRAIRILFLVRMKKRKEELDYDVLILNVGWANPVMPWSLIVLGTKLVKEGKKVRLMDGHCGESHIIEEASRAPLIGFSVMTAQINSSLKLSRQIKKLYPDKSIVWGGVHPTLFPEQCLKEDCIDFIILGDGEDALTALSYCLENKDYKFHDIPGLGFKDNATLVVNPMGKPVSFEDAGPWRFDLLDMRNYLNWAITLVDFKYPSLSFLASRGCPKGCAFCINSIVKHTRIHRVKPVESVLDEIEQLIHKYHARTINFPDEAFFIDPNYFASFAEGILRRNLKFEWGGGAHIADILKHKDLILGAKKAGLIYIGGSGESGSNRLLRLLKKGITVEDTLECMHFLAENDLMTVCSFMTHLPTETRKERRATLNLIEHIKNIFRKKRNPSYIMGPAIFRPYPGSELYNICLRSGFKEPKTLDEWGRMILPDGSFKIDNITWLA